MRGCPRRLDGRPSPPAEVAEKKRCQPPNLGRCGPRSPRKAGPKYRCRAWPSRSRGPRAHEPRSRGVQRPRRAKVSTSRRNADSSRVAPAFLVASHTSSILCDWERCEQSTPGSGSPTRPFHTDHVERSVLSAGVAEFMSKGYPRGSAKKVAGTFSLSGGTRERSEGPACRSRRPAQIAATFARRRTLRMKQ